MIYSPEHNELVGKLAVSPLDIMRLFVEFAEEADVTQSAKEDIIASFRRVIRSGVSSVAESERSVSFETAMRESLEVRRIRRSSTVADLRSYMNRMLEYAEFRAQPLRCITSEQCIEMLRELFGHSPHVFRKAKAVLHSVFAYGQRRGWCRFNPVKAIECPPVYEERIVPLTGCQIRALMRACRRDEFCSMLPAMQLLLWCGIRPGEVRRLHWRDIDRREKCVYIEGRASKTGGPRAVPLRGAAKELLHYNRRGDEKIAPRNWTRLWRKLRKRAGLTNWQRDVLRHTFASYHLKCFHNLPQLQEEMGHRDCNLLRTRYLNVRHVSSATARRFFA